MKPTINEWAQDCANLGRLMKRFAFANAHLAEIDISDAENAVNTAACAFAHKYEVSQAYARYIAIIIAESVSI